MQGNNGTAFSSILHSLTIVHGTVRVPIRSRNLLELGNLPRDYSRGLRTAMQDPRTVRYGSAITSRFVFSRKFVAVELSTLATQSRVSANAVRPGALHGGIVTTSCSPRRLGLRALVMRMLPSAFSRVRACGGFPSRGPVGERTRPPAPTRSCRSRRCQRARAGPSRYAPERASANRLEFSFGATAYGVGTPSYWRSHRASDAGAITRII